MKADREVDKKELLEIPKEKLVELLFLQLRNLWSTDGLYFLGIEERFGTDSATEIDRKVWEIMGKIEARRLKELMGFSGDDLGTLSSALLISSWALDLEDKEIIIEKDRVLFRNPNCRVQKTRLKKDLGEFPCKQVRWGYLKSFAREINENIEVLCNFCPPDPHSADMWCEWVFKLKQ